MILLPRSFRFYILFPFYTYILNQRGGEWWHEVIQSSFHLNLLFLRSHMYAKWIFLYAIFYNALIYFFCSNITNFRAEEHKKRRINFFQTASSENNLKAMLYNFSRETTKKEIYLIPLLISNIPPAHFYTTKQEALFYTYISK